MKKFQKFYSGDVNVVVEVDRLPYSQELEGGSEEP